MQRGKTLHLTHIILILRALESAALWGTAAILTQVLLTEFSLNENVAGAIAFAFKCIVYSCGFFVTLLVLKNRYSSQSPDVMVLGLLLSWIGYCIHSFNNIAEGSLIGELVALLMIGIGASCVYITGPHLLKTTMEHEEINKSFASSQEVWRNGGSMLAIFCIPLAHDIYLELTVICIIASCATGFGFLVADQYEKITENADSRPIKLKNHTPPSPEHMRFFTTLMMLTCFFWVVYFQFFNSWTMFATKSLDLAFLSPQQSVMLNPLILVIILVNMRNVAWDDYNAKIAATLRGAFVGAAALVPIVVLAAIAYITGKRVPAIVALPLFLTAHALLAYAEAHMVVPLLEFASKTKNPVEYYARLYLPIGVVNAVAGVLIFVGYGSENALLYFLALEIVMLFFACAASFYARRSAPAHVPA